MLDVLFITSSDKNELKSEVNGTMLLATKLLQASFSVDVMRFYQCDHYGLDYELFICDITQQILQKAPRCVSFYTLWPYYHIMLRISREIKKQDPRIITIMGGPQASATAVATIAAMDSVDYVCTGEGENTVVPFFTAVLEKRYEELSMIPGLHFRKNGEVCSNDKPVPLSDLNALPQWDKRLIGERGKEEHLTSSTYFMPIDIGRGCPFGCTFCSSSRFWRRNYRMKTPERIIEDVLFYKEKYGIRSFSFGHDAFTVNQNLVTTICDSIIAKKLDIKWKCTTRADCVSEELILKMMEAGMTHIELGVETGSQRMQKIIGKKLNLNKVKELVLFLLRNGIYVALSFMYGFPEETEEDLNETLELLFDLIDIGVQYTSMFMCQFNPKAQITQEYFDQLVFDPGIKVLSRAVFGYEDEKQMILDNKAIFPFYYHLNTPVRNEYQYLILFNHWYEQFPKTIVWLRRLYKGNNLQFYKDFCNENPDCFSGAIDDAVKYIKEKGWEMMLNVLKKHTLPYMEQLQAALKFSYDYKKVSLSKKDVTHREVYNFNYLDYMRKRPFEQYSDSKTDIILQKINGKVSMKILGLQ